MATPSKIVVTVDSHRYEVGITDVCSTELYRTGRTTSRVYMSTKVKGHFPTPVDIWITEKEAV